MQVTFKEIKKGLMWKWGGDVDHLASILGLLSSLRLSSQHTLFVFKCHRSNHIDFVLESFLIFVFSWIFLFRKRWGFLLKHIHWCRFNKYFSCRTIFMTFLTMVLFFCNVSLSTDPHNESGKTFQASNSSQNRRKGEAKHLINIYWFSFKQCVAFMVC